MAGTSGIARATHELFEAVWPRRCRSYFRKRAVICARLFIFTPLLAWAGVSFDTLGQIASFVVGSLALASAMFAAPYLDFKLPFADRGRRRCRSTKLRASG